MAENDAEQRREKVRALKELREQTEVEDLRETVPEATAEDVLPRRGKLQQFLQRQARGGGAERPGGGRLREMLTQSGGSGEWGRRGRGAVRRSARANAEDWSGAVDDESPAPDRATEPTPKRGRFRGLGNRSMLKRRIEAQAPNAHLLLSELQNTVRQLKEEVERLRADRRGKASAKKRTSPAAGKRPRRKPKKSSK